MWTVVLKIFEIALVIGGAIASIISGRLWLEAQKHRSVAEAKDEIIGLLTNSVDAWKSRYEAEHVEHNDYRKRQHDHNNETNARMLQLAEENSGLKAKTDLSPMMETLATFIEGQNRFMKDLTEINGRILSALTNLERRINGRAKKKRA
jgi:hypothetical protein